MNRVLVGALLGMTLTGCATTGDLLAKKPEFDYSTPKAPAEVLRCVTDKWSDKGLRFREDQMGKGTVLTWLLEVSDQYGAAAVMVEPEGAGSHVTYHLRDMMVLMGGGMAVRDCR